MSKTRKILASTYRYDPLNRLTTTNSVQRFYNNTRIATEIEGERKTRFFETDSQPLALQQHGSGVGTTLLATDQQSSVLSGVSPDGTQHAQVYTPFGYHVHDALLSAIGFNGERPEPETGHYLLGQGYRAFNPVLMRFNSPDSWSPFGEGGINAYAYCDNEPMMRQDPTGHMWQWVKAFGRGLGIMKTSKQTNKIIIDLQNTVVTTMNNINKNHTFDLVMGSKAFDQANNLSTGQLIKRSRANLAKADDLISESRQFMQRQYMSPKRDILSPTNLKKARGSEKNPRIDVDPIQEARRVTGLKKLSKEKELQALKLLESTYNVLRITEINRGIRTP
ncbi:RHS repeat-associated core domain-containing protein [Pseudomonas lundensis]|uniref:RHS repeat-associated core domain-containing protein n=1 Tax=Pseudomonas lundensis TaxID=86185 RepID=UPI00193C2161|nr:RHS repeat-associated core domain-containing protein [Pseudomonas lundensis]MBM1188560.1 RHS repeat-associated core domain-containing protein [Pseudomonas lundensis]